MDEPNDLKATPRNSLNGGAIANGNHKMKDDDSSPKPSPSRFPRYISTLARVLTWYVIATVIFRCPASHESCDESTPGICRPYLHAKAVVAPHVGPYYDAYAAPYVDVAQTYYSTVDRTVLMPARSVAAKYVSPKVTDATNYVESLWQKNVEPRLTEYHALGEFRYKEHIAPHVAYATEAAIPYLDLARASAIRTYHELLLPAYDNTRPHVIRIYHHATDFTTNTVAPAIAWSFKKSYFFVHDTIWPHVRAIYVESVEPQLHRIGRRLDGYKTTGGSHTARTAR
jgi:hypothetical protein